MKRRRKFNNTPTVIDGLPFDSKKESRRWVELCALLRIGKIAALRRQVRIPLRMKDVIVAKYVADFVYVEAGQRVVEDVKSPITRLDKTYRLKRRMLAALGVEIREV